MKFRKLIIASAIAFSTPVALAQQDEPMETDSTAEVTPPPVMMQRMEEMQEHWEKMMQADDPDERRKLMEEHRQKMQELAGTMRRMQGVGQGETECCRDVGSSGQGMRPMRQRMEEMHAHMEKMMQTDDPAERRKLMQEHRQKMRETMAMRGDMEHDTGRGRQHGRSRRQADDEWAMAAFRQMEKRLDLMQILLERLLDKE